MSYLRSYKAKGISSSAEPQNLSEVASITGNLYETLSVASKRANQISVKLKEELSSKLDEFANTNETLDEVMENREQIEISKYYERLPNPVLLAMSEFRDGEIYYRKREERDNFKKDNFKKDGFKKDGFKK